jgi:hypothetical protein
MMSTYRPDGKVSGLGMQSASAFLLFATAAKNCVVNNNGEISRDCIVEEVSKVREWAGGGLHAVASPGNNEPSPCYQMITIANGKFTRLYPPQSDRRRQGSHFNRDDYRRWLGLRRINFG